MNTNGRANGSLVIRGPHGGEYYINTNGRPQFIGLLYRYLVDYF